jgi:hypothetical protein
MPIFAAGLRQGHNEFHDFESPELLERVDVPGPDAAWVTIGCEPGGCAMEVEVGGKTLRLVGGKSTNEELTAMALHILRTS